MAAVMEMVLDEEKEFEIVDGKPEEKVMGGAQHGGVGSRLIVKLGTHIEMGHLGAVYGPDTSFRIGENERMPDVSFVSVSRIPEAGEPVGIWPIPPDLAVEIASPSDLYEKVMAKVFEYLIAGVRQVWLISIEHRMVTVYFSLTESRILQETDELDGGDIIPGFRCPVADLFKAPTRL